MQPTTAPVLRDKGALRHEGQRAHAEKHQAVEGGGIAPLSRRIAGFAAFSLSV